MNTRFGPEAKNGDYVIVLDADYVHRRATNYIAKVHKNKAYTGQTMQTAKGTRYIHKIVAEVVISEDMVPEETKLLIEKDISING